MGNIRRHRHRQRNRDALWWNSVSITQKKKSLQNSDAAIWGSKGNRWVMAGMQMPCKQLQNTDWSPTWCPAQFAPFTGYDCVIISINYRLTHRTTDATGPHVSNTNVSLHKSITRNIFCAFKAQLKARGERGRRVEGGGGGSDWKSIWWKTILFWFCTRTTNQLMAAADLEPTRPANVLHVPLCPLRRGICCYHWRLSALELGGPHHAAVPSNCLIVGANELITCHLTLIGSYQFSMGIIKNLKHATLAPDRATHRAALACNSSLSLSLCFSLHREPYCSLPDLWSLLLGPTHFLIR